MRIIDGSILEGGGQIVRNSVSLAAILHHPIKIHSIRGRRSKPGLAAQHAAGIRLVSKISQMIIQGCSVNSKILEMNNDSIKSLKVHACLPSSEIVSIDEDAGTAGAISLMIQTSLPVAIFEKTCSEKYRLTLRGGTNVSSSPPIDHTKHVLFPLLSNMGLHMSADEALIIHKRGYFPKGCGEISMNFAPIKDSHLLPITLRSQGIFTAINGIIFGDCSCEDKETYRYLLLEKLELIIKEIQLPNLSEEIKIQISISDELKSTHSKSTVRSATLSSSPQIPVPDKINNSKYSKDDNSVSNKQSKVNLGIQLWTSSCGATPSPCVLQANDLIRYIPSPPAAEICTQLQDSADKVVGELLALVASGACIDERTADQLILYMALASGRSEILVEPDRNECLHLASTIHIISTFLGDQAIINIVTQENGCRLIICNGIS